MAPKLPSLGASSCTTLSSITRIATGPSPPSLRLLGQTRAATYIHRPRRPYTFTQLIQLSDGSTYSVRTTSPSPLYRAEKDSRNTLLWQPSEKSLKNVEHDEAGKLAAFRTRFGTGFDVSSYADAGADAAAQPVQQQQERKGGRALREADIKKIEEDRIAAAAAAKKAEENVLDLGELISGYAPAPPSKEDNRHLARKNKDKGGKKK